MVAARTARTVSNPKLIVPTNLQTVMVVDAILCACAIARCDGVSGGL